MLVDHPPTELEGYRPGPGTDPERDGIMKAFNAHLCWEGPLSDGMVAFYRHRISRALDEVENTPAPENGVIIWRIYSSGTIVKCREGTFAFEVAEGPVPSVPILPEEIRTSGKHYDFEGKEVATHVPPIAEEFNIGPLAAMAPPIHWNSFQILQPQMYWTPAMRRHFAEVIDASLHSHKHWDHFGVALAGEVLRAGKTVVAPSDVRQMCMGWDIEGAERIETLPQDRTALPSGAYVGPSQGPREYAVAGVRVMNYPGYQDEYHARPEGDRLVWSLNRTAKFEVGMEMYAFVVKMGGLNMFWPAEVRGCPTYYPWLVSLLRSDWCPDVCVSSFCYDTAHDDIVRLYDPIIMRIHQLEFGHTFLQLWEEDPRPLFHGASAKDLFWGEKITI